MTRNHLIAAILAVPMVALAGSAYAGASSWGFQPTKSDREVGMAQVYVASMKHTGGWACRYRGGPKAPIEHYREK
jgi:hypothetical protein